MVGSNINNNLKWEVLSTKYLFHDTWLKARMDKCIRRDGKIIDPYYVMEYPEWAAGFALTDDNKILMVRQYRHALGEVCIELPGGCVDTSDSSPEFAIRREFLEETGYAFEAVEYLGKTSANPSTNANCLHMFLLTGGAKVQEQDLDQNEEIQVLTIDFLELKRLLDENGIMQSMHVTCIYYALQKLGKMDVRW